MKYQEYPLSKQEKISLLAVLVAGCLLLGVLFYNCWVVAVGAIGLYRPAEKVYCRMRVAKRKEALRAGFRDYLNYMAISFASGRHFPEATAEAERELQHLYSEGEPILEEVRLLRERMGEKADEIVLLRDWYDRSGLEEIQEFTESYAVCRDTGGDLIHAMEKTARMISEKIRIEKEIETMADEKKLEGRIILAMPVGLLLFLRVASPDYIQVLYQGVGGRLVMTAVLGMSLFSCVLTERILRIEV